MFANRNTKPKIQHVLLAALITFTAACTAEEAQLPADVPALPADMQARMKTLQLMAQKYRGLSYRNAVPSGALGEAGLKKKLGELIIEELPPEKMHAFEVGLKAFDFIPQDMNLGKYLPELLTSQVGGYYDPRRKYLITVKKDNDQLSDRMQETVLVHELTHAIQDQHFNLIKFMDGDTLSDKGAARQAIVEGDATLTMYDYFYNMNMEKLGMEEILNQMVKDPKALIEMSPDMPGKNEIMRAPPYLRDTLLFPYLQGWIFCMNLKKVGGQKLLDYAFTHDPPRSTEQILHPEKWHTNRDDPIEISFPDLGDDLAGYKKVKEGQLGEFGIRIFLREKLKDEETASNAAAGWGGDRFAVYENGDKRVLTWITEWDTDADAKKFKAAADKIGGEWKVEAAGARRVNIIRGDVGDATAINEKLAKASSKKPENTKIDLASIGVTPKSNENTVPDVTELLKTLTDNGGDGGLDLGELLKGVTQDNGDGKGDKKAAKKSDDKTDAVMNELLKQLDNGENEKVNGLDMKEMLKNPAIQEMMKGMMSQDRPQGTASDDGRTYTNDGLGFSIKAPADKKWKLDPKPPIPMASVLIQGPEELDGAPQVSVVSQALPMAMDIAAMGPMLEMGPKMAFKNYKKISAGNVEAGGKKGYELQYEGEQGGASLHCVQRMFTVGSTMLVVSGLCPASKWSGSEKAIKEILDSLTFTEAKKDAAKKQAPASDKLTEPER
jgi:hypothetical protein